MIKRGYNEELDSVTGDMNDSKGFLPVLRLNSVI